MRLIYPACFYPDEEQKGFYTVVVPDLPGCVSEGNTLDEAILRATDAAAGWILAELGDGKPITTASPIKNLIPDTGGF